jgi:hypothetical protein
MSFISEEKVIEEKKVAKRLGVMDVDMFGDIISMRCPIRFEDLSEYGHIKPSVRVEINDILRENNVEDLYIITKDVLIYEPKTHKLYDVQHEFIELMYEKIVHPIPVAHFDREGFWFNVKSLELQGVPKSLDKIIKDHYNLHYLWYE